MTHPPAQRWHLLANVPLHPSETVGVAWRSIYWRSFRSDRPPQGSPCDWVKKGSLVFLGVIGVN